jgi:hypothetical protein
LLSIPPLTPLYIAAISCLDSFEGGGWALVRRAGQGNKWSPAKDNLAGYDSFGVDGTRPADTTTMTVPYSQWLWPQTQVLFATGMSAVAFLKHVIHFNLTFSLFYQGDMSKWMYTTYEQISGDGRGYMWWSSTRTVIKSSSSSTSCKRYGLY